MSKKTVVGSTSVGILSSILAFLGVVSCCGMPIIAGVLTWLGIGASQLSFFAAYRPLFIGIAIVALLFGFWKVYFTKSTNCCDAPKKEKKSTSMTVQKIALWAGAIMIIILLFMDSQPPASSSPEPLAPAEHLQSEQSNCCPN